MKDGLPCSSLDIPTETAATRAKQKSPIMARGGVESEMRMFDWERDGYPIRSFARARRLTGLMSPCAMLRWWRYRTPLTAPESYVVTIYGVS